jgi:serine beta-lactamase-like protein LACTB
MDACRSGSRSASPTIGTNAPVTHETRFRIGSLSKLLTATAAAILWERGVLDLDSPAQSLVPEFTARHAVTPRQLAGHIGGVRHYVTSDFMRPPARYDDVVATLGIFSADSLIASPGTRYHYSSCGYNLLGATIQRAAREEYRALVSRLVLGPFGLGGVVAERSDSVIGNASRGYEPVTGGPPRPTARTDLSDRWPSGGWLGTATDLARFADGSVRGSLLSTRVRELLFTAMRTADGASTNVGFGWRIGADSSGRVVYHHGGASVGGRAMLMVWRDQPLAIAITTNVSNARISEADAMRLGRMLLDR